MSVFAKITHSKPKSHTRVPCGPGQHRIEEGTSLLLPGLPFKNLNLGAGEMTQWSRALVVLLEDMGTIPSTLVAAHYNSSPGDRISASVLPLGVQTSMQIKHPHT